MLILFIYVYSAKPPGNDFMNLLSGFLVSFTDRLTFFVNANLFVIIRIVLQTIAENTRGRLELLTDIYILYLQCPYKS